MKGRRGFYRRLIHSLYNAGGEIYLEKLTRKAYPIKSEVNSQEDTERERLPGRQALQWLST